MDILFWALMIVVILLITIAIIASTINSGPKRAFNYQSFLIIGIVWIIVGVFLINFGLIIAGIIFIIWSLIKIKTWKRKKEEAIKIREEMPPRKKKILSVLQISIIILFLVGIYLYKESTQKNEISSEVLGATTGSECLEKGALTETYVYNENSKTWWIDLEMKPEFVQEDCSPACVIDENLHAKINWRCTGAILE